MNTKQITTGREKPQREETILLHDIRSAENVGSIFRTADASGVSKIFLTGYTPLPIDRFGRKRKDIMKASLGAEEYVPWEARKNALALLRTLARRGYFLVALEQSRRSTDYRDIPKKEPLCLIVGNEVSGVPKSILSKADAIAEIPMRGRKESLNVSVAAGIALFEIFNSSIQKLPRRR